MEILGPSRESLIEDFTQLQEGGVGDFFNSHMDYLTDQLFLVESGSLESRLLRRQIQELSRLNSLYQNEFQRPFTREANAEISERFHVIFSLLESGNDLSDIREEIEGLIDRELDRLADTFMTNTFRDKVEGSIDFKGWGLRETYNETQEMTIFLDAFTIEYINFLEGEVGEMLDYNDIPDNLMLSETSLSLVLSETLERIRTKNRENYDEILQFEIGFSRHSGGEIIVDLSDFDLQMEQVEEDTQTPQVTVDIHAPELQSEPDVVVVPEIPQRDMDYQQVIELTRQGILPIEEAYRILEGEDGFQEDRNDGLSLGYALQELGFSDELQRDINTIFERELSQQEINNLIDMMRYFLYVESSTGYNVSNYQGASTARGYFQYLTGDGGYVRQVYRDDAWHTQGRWGNDDTEREGEVRRFWGNNSYETGLLRIPASIRSLRPIFNQELKKIGSPLNEDGTLNQNPMSLSSEEQIILFLSDLQERPGVTSDMINRMLSGDIQAVEALYTEHHTDPDRETHLRMLLAKQEVYGIAIDVFSLRGDSVEGIILPGVNMTEFFMELITELNPNTSLSSGEIMQSLDTLGTIRFQAGGIISISRSSEDGVAYNLEYNGEAYMRVLNSGEFRYLM